MAQAKFFDERKDQSEVKARIVQKYFSAWANVVMSSAEKRDKKISYIDLYSGPGRYKDGAASTPLLILEKAVADQRMSKMLVSVFNDENRDYSGTLANEIAKIKGIANLKYAPDIMCSPVDDEMERKLRAMNLVPTFTFFDPFGYKGLSQGIIGAVLKDWGCDCIFFFNYNRINAAINNGIVEKHMEALFGPERIARLREILPTQKPHVREALIMEELALALKDQGAKYVLPFRFRNAKDTRTTHCLIFVSKHHRGYGIMKEIMASESTAAEQGVPSFSYFPADESTPLLFSLSQPLDELVAVLPKIFAGQKLTMIEVFEQHNVDTPYIKKNYKAALMTLEAAKKIKCVPPATARRKATFADHVEVQFPKS